MKIRAVIKKLWAVIKAHLGWLAGLVFVLAVAGGASELALDEGSTDEPASCPDSYTSRSVPAKAASKPTPLVPIGADGDAIADPSMTFAFGPSRGAMIRTQAFLIPDDARRKAQRFGLIVGLMDTDSGESIPAQALRGRIGPISIAKRAVRFRLCIDPTPAGHSEVRPGTYAGAVMVGRPASRPEQVAFVPITVTASDTRKRIAMLAVLIGVIAGIAVRAAADLRSTTGTAAKFKDYLFSLPFLVMLAGGLLAGALVYGPLFADKPDGTVDLFDSLLPLAAAAFTATLAAKSLADLSPTSAERRTGVDEPADPP